MQNVAAQSPDIRIHVQTPPGTPRPTDALMDPVEADAPLVVKRGPRGPTGYPLLAVRGIPAASAHNAARSALLAMPASLLGLTLQCLDANSLRMLRLASLALRGRVAAHPALKASLRPFLEAYSALEVVFERIEALDAQTDAHLEMLHTRAQLWSDRANTADTLRRFVDPFAALGGAGGGVVTIFGIAPLLEDASDTQQAGIDSTLAVGLLVITGSTLLFGLMRTCRSRINTRAQATQRLSVNARMAADAADPAQELLDQVAPLIRRVASAAFLVGAALPQVPAGTDGGMHARAGDAFAVGDSPRIRAGLSHVFDLPNSVLSEQDKYEWLSEVTRPLLDALAAEPPEGDFSSYQALCDSVEAVVSAWALDESELVRLCDSIYTYICQDNIALAAFAAGIYSSSADANTIANLLQPIGAQDSILWSARSTAQQIRDQLDEEWGTLMLGKLGVEEA